MHLENPSSNVAWLLKSQLRYVLAEKTNDFLSLANVNVGLCLKFKYEKKAPAEMLYHLNWFKQVGSLTPIQLF